MQLVKSLAGKRFLVILLSSFVVLQVSAKGKPDNPGGGKPGKGDSEPTSECPTPPILLNNDVISVSNNADEFVKQRSKEDALDPNDVTNLVNAELHKYSVLGCTPLQSDDFDTTYFGKNIAEPDTLHESWRSNLVFSDDFDGTGNHLDYSETFDYRRWSSKYAFSTDAKINTIPGEDAHWNVNTTGRYPGEGIDLSNFYNNSSETAYLDTVERTGKVFELTTDGMRIVARRNPDPIRKINGAKPYISGLLSSHANADPVKKDLGLAPHGFEFRYGYAEMRAKLPEQGNGFRAAFWLYSDNAFYNNLIRGSEFIPNDNRHEIDVMEYLPNSGNTVDGYSPQSILFGGVDNDARDDDKKILTYDTIFHTYHYNNGTKRTPTDWTFNAEDRYKTRRAAVFPAENSGPNNPPYAMSTTGFVTYGVLWLPNKIEWYVNDVLVHQVLENGTEEIGFQAIAPVFDKRMYIIANLAMGLGVFEGEEVDSSLLDTVNEPDTDNDTAFEIDYIKVWQPSGIEGAEWCGYGYLGEKWCDGTIGLEPIGLD